MSGRFNLFGSIKMVKRKKNNNGKVPIPAQLIKIKVKTRKIKKGYKITGYKEKKTYKEHRITGYKEKVVYDKSGLPVRVKKVPIKTPIYKPKLVPIETPTYKTETEVRITSPALREAARKRLQLPKLKKYGKYLIPTKRIVIKIGKRR